MSAIPLVPLVLQYHGMDSTIVHATNGMYHTMVWYWYVVHVYVLEYQWYVQHYLKNDLKYKHSGATGTLASGLVGVVSIEGITVYYS
jgi:hypothetical protein